jgi:hypothetical protein
VAVATVARADAPMSQYQQFDLTNQTIFDQFTRLKWERYASSSTYTFDQAAAYCASGTHGEGTTGWRVPSYKELLTIVDEAPHDEYENLQINPKWYDYNAFFGTPVDAPYWSSSLAPPLNPADPPSAFSVDFGNGHGQRTLTRLASHVRCVHD